jgi:hypothetical protein
VRRPQAIFDWIFSVPRWRRGHGADSAGTDAAANAADDDDKYELHYLSCPNVGLDAAALEARRQREKASLASVRVLSVRYGRSLADVGTFVHTQHDLYSASQLVARSGGNSSDDDEAPKAGKHVGAATDASKPSQIDAALARSYGA